MAGSGSEAAERILAARPDVLVCDLGMPDEDGYSLIRKLRVSREEPRERLALDRAERLCAIRGSYKSHPLRFSESSGEARGTSRVVSGDKQPGTPHDHNLAKPSQVIEYGEGWGRGAFAEGTPVTMAQRSVFV